MARMNEIDRFRTVWNMESQLTTKLLEALPPDQYDFRPDPGNRSIGEMAWHLAEIEGYISLGISQGAIAFQESPPNMQRPREIRLLRRDTARSTRTPWRGWRISPRTSSTRKCSSPTDG